jgi:hypothetical protein
VRLCPLLLQCYTPWATCVPISALKVSCIFFAYIPTYIPTYILKCMSHSLLAVPFVFAKDKM